MRRSSKDGFGKPPKSNFQMVSNWIWRNRVLISILISISIVFTIVFLALKNQFELNENELLLEFEKDTTLQTEINGEFKELDRRKSKIPIVYYYSGKMPVYGLMNIKNTLRFHETVYFVSQDLYVDLEGVKNINDSNFKFPKEVEEKLANSSSERLRAVHSSDFRRIAMFDIFPNGNYIYSDLDEIIFRPIHRCNFVTMSWNGAYSEVVSSFFCLNRTILDALYERQKEVYDPRCWGCLGPSLLSDVFYENKWNVNVDKSINDVSLNYEMLFKNPLLHANIDHIHIYKNRSIANFQHLFQLTGRLKSGWVPRHEIVRERNREIQLNWEKLPEHVINHTESVLLDNDDDQEEGNLNE